MSYYTWDDLTPEIHESYRLACEGVAKFYEGLEMLRSAVGIWSKIPADEADKLKAGIRAAEAIRNDISHQIMQTLLVKRQP